MLTGNEYVPVRKQVLPWAQILVCGALGLTAVTSPWQEWFILVAEKE